MLWLGSRSVSVLRGEVIDWTEAFGQLQSDA
jgi:hypothetical protein